MKYRHVLSRFVVAQHEEPIGEYVHLSDVEDLLNSIERDFNALKERLLKELINTKDEFERRLEIMSDDLY